MLSPTTSQVQQARLLSKVGGDGLCCQVDLGVGENSSAVVEHREVLLGEREPEACEGQQGVADGAGRLGIRLLVVSIAHARCDVLYAARRLRVGGGLCLSQPPRLVLYLAIDPAPVGHMPHARPASTRGGRRGFFHDVEVVASQGGF